MKKSRFTESQIVAVLKEGEAGIPVVELCRKHGISSATYYQWKSKYSGVQVTLSDFQPNRLDSSDNPVLLKRELQTDLMAKNGEIVVLGGLSGDKKNRYKSGFFGLNFAKSKNHSKSQLVLLL